MLQVSRIPKRILKNPSNNHLEGSIENPRLGEMLQVSRIPKRILKNPSNNHLEESSENPKLRKILQKSFKNQNFKLTTSTLIEFNLTEFIILKDPQLLKILRKSFKIQILS